MPLSPTFLKSIKNNSDFDPEKSIASLPILKKILFSILPFPKSISIASLLIFLKFVFEILYV